MAQAEEPFFVSKPFLALEEGHILTKEFLHSCQGIVEFVAMLGRVFQPVRSDISGNIGKVRHRFQLEAEDWESRNRFLDDLIQIEMEEIKAEGRIPMGMAAEGLLWLKSLEFLLLVLADYDEGRRSEGTKTIAQAAYEKTLKPHHNWAIRNVFRMCAHAAPYRATLLDSMSSATLNSEEKVIEALRLYLPNFSSTVQCLRVIFTHHQIPN